MTMQAQHRTLLLKTTAQAAAVLALAALTVSAASAASASASGGTAARDPIAPLLADDGTPMPSVQSAQRRLAAPDLPAPGWATPAQMAQLQRAIPGRVLRVSAGRQPAALPAAARDAWVFVDGAESAALPLAWRLVRQGYATVWVLAPQRSAAAGAAARSTAAAAFRSAP
jgi:hypothetical protein